MAESRRSILAIGAAIPALLSASAAWAASCPTPITSSSVCDVSTLGAGPYELQGGTVTIDSTGSTYSAGFVLDHTFTNTIFQDGNAVVFSGVFSDQTSGTYQGSGSIVISNQGHTGTQGSVTFTANETYTGATTIDNGASLLIKGGSIADSADVNANGKIDFSKNTAATSIVGVSGSSGGSVVLGAYALTLSNAGQSATDTFAGQISNSGTGTGGITLTTGTETLTGVNSYVGATSINGGTLALSGSGSIATSSGVAFTSSSTAGTFDISGLTAGTSIESLSDAFGKGQVVLGSNTLTLTAGSGSFAGVVQGTGGLTVNGSATETLTGTNTYHGATTIGSGETLALASTGSLTNSSSIADSGTLRFNGSNALTQRITGSGGVAVTAGSVSLSGSLGYSGVTAISSNTTLAVTGTGTLASFEVFDDGALVFRSGGANAYGNQITGTGGLTVGSGTLTLSGASNYHGATTVDGGATLLLTGSLQSTVGVLAGAKLEGTGTVGGGYNVNNSGVVEPGDAPGTLDITGNYTQTGTGDLAIEIGGTPASGDYSVLDVSGAAVLAGNLDIDEYGGFSLSNAIGGTYDIMNFASLTGDFTSVSLNGTGDACTAAGTDVWICGGEKVTEVIGDTSLDLVITGVPEPGTLGLLAGGVLGFGWLRRRFFG